jgi:hypothetical protein
MPGTAGTDSHSRSDIGRVATDFERDIHDVAGLIAELKAGRFEAVDLTNKPHRLDLTALSSLDPS